MSNVNYHSSVKSGNSGIFDGFVRNALGSVLDYDSSSIGVSGDDLDLGKFRHKIFYEESALLGNTLEKSESQGHTLGNR